MTVKEKLHYLKDNYGITITFVANKIGTTYNILYRSTMDRDNKNYRALSSTRKKKLNEFFKLYNL